MTATPNTAALQALLMRVEAGDETAVVDMCRDPAFPFAQWDAVILAYRGSLDAAKTLHNALLPEWHWQLCSDMRDGVAEIWPHGMYNIIIKVGDEDEWIDPARAWLIAIIKALISGDKSAS